MFFYPFIQLPPFVSFYFPVLFGFFPYVVKERFMLPTYTESKRCRLLQEHTKYKHAYYQMHALLGLQDDFMEVYILYLPQLKVNYSIPLRDLQY